MNTGIAETSLRTGGTHACPRKVPTLYIIFNILFIISKFIVINFG